MKHNFFYKQSITLLLICFLIFSQFLNIFPVVAEELNQNSSTIGSPVITVLSPKAILEPSTGQADDKDGYPPVSSNADPEEFILTAKIQVNDFPISNPVAHITDNNLDGFDDLSIDSAKDVDIDYLDGTDNNSLATGTYYLYWNLKKDQSIAKANHQEAYTVSVSYTGGNDSGSEFIIDLEGSTGVKQNDLKRIETYYPTLGNIGSSFNIINKYEQPSTNDLNDLILQSYYDADLFRLDKVELYFYDGGTTGSVLSGSIPSGSTQSWSDTAALSVNDIPSELSNGDNWITSYQFTVIGVPTGITTLSPYIQTKPSETSNWKVDSGYQTPIILNGQPQLSIIKSANPSSGTLEEPALINAGSKINYTITYTNSGSAAASEVMIVDKVPSFSIVDENSISDGGIYNPNSKTITWYLPPLAVGATGQVSFSVDVDKIIANGTIIENLATISSPGSEETQSNHTYHKVFSSPVLSISKSANPASGSSVNPGDEITYTLTYANTGDDAAHNVVITDNVPANTTWVSGGTLIGGSVNFAIGEVAAGTSSSVSFKAKVNTPLANGTVISNYGIIDSDQTETENSNTVTHTVSSLPDLSIVKNAYPQEGTLGQMGSDNNGNAITITSSTKMTFTAKPIKIKKGMTTVLRGTLKNSSGKAIANKKVTIKKRVLKKIKKKVKGKIKIIKKYIWKKFRTVKTNKQGQFKLKIRLNKSHSFRAFFDGEKPKNQTSSHEGSVKKQGSLNAGSKINYILTYSNKGSDTASSIIVKDTVPAHTKIDKSSISDGGIYDENTNTITWTRPPLAVGATGTISFSVYVDDVITAGTVIENYGTVSSPEIEIPVNSNHTYNEINPPSILNINNTVSTQTIYKKSVSKSLKILVIKAKKSTPKWIKDGDNG